MRVAFFFVLIGIMGVTTGWAQGNPSDFARPGPKAERERYFAQVRFEINEVMVRWQRAWERDDAAELSRLYDPDATFYAPTAEAAHSRAAIGNYFASYLPLVGNVEFRMVDFGTSGDLAYVTGRVVYNTSQASGLARQVVRTDMLALRRRLNNQWQIVTHIAREEPLGRPAENITH